MTDIAGIVLAGGLARRMGGSDKPLVQLAGKPLLARGLERLAPQCARLLINANGDASRFATFALPVTPDTVPHFAGPLAGILAGLDHLASQYPAITHAVSVPADTPFIPRDLVLRLDTARRSAGADIAIAASGGRNHNAVALWPVSIRHDLREALVDRDERSIGRFAGRFKVVTVAWPDAPFDPFFNVNTPDDLIEAEAILRTGASA
jgi:molybdopterin-guanine dinucleotide biosynthesis protein A